MNSDGVLGTWQSMDLSQYIRRDSKSRLDRFPRTYLCTDRYGINLAVHFSQMKIGWSNLLPFVAAVILTA